MKKLLSLLLILALTAACLCGCGSQSTEMAPVSSGEAYVADLEPGTIHTGNGSLSSTPIEVVGMDDLELTGTIDTSGLHSYFDEDRFVAHFNYEIGDMTLSLPETVSSVSAEKIGSAFSETYTVPSLSVDVPEYEHKEIESVFVSMADNADAEDQEKLASMTEEEFASVAAVQLSLIDAFVKAFEEAGISVPIDPLSGAIPIDSALLYDTDQYALTEEGKTALRTVFVPYYKVLSDPQYRDLIANVVIEGHTDTQGDYAYNQTLSERRAQAVYEYLLSEECGLEDTEFLRSILNVVGRSYDNPVYAADGSVDMAASRRVEIRFLLNLDA